MVCMLLNMFEARPMNENKTQSGEKKEEVNLNNGYDSQFDHISEQKKNTTTTAEATKNQRQHNNAHNNVYIKLKHLKAIKTLKQNILLSENVKMRMKLTCLLFFFLLLFYLAVSIKKISNKNMSKINSQSHLPPT